MGIYLPNMEMPKTCADCRFIYADPNIEYEQPDGTKMVGGCCCCFTGNVIWNTKRDDDCPFGEVPNDGVVISEDEFQYYSRAMLVALALRDLLVVLNRFAEVPNVIRPVANAPADKEAEE